MALMIKPTHDPKVTRWWWRTLREWVYLLVDPLWEAFRGENSADIALTNVTSINGISSAEFGLLDGLTTTTSELNLLAGLTAEAAELNKADRTQTDGVAEASKNVVLDADKDILGKGYDINRSLLVALANRPALHFDGVDDYMSLGAVPIDSGGTFSYIFQGVELTDSDQYIFTPLAGGTYKYLRVSRSTIRISFGNSPTNPALFNISVPVGPHTMVITYSADQTLSCYLDGVLVGQQTNWGPLVAFGVHELGRALYADNEYYRGPLSGFKAFNREFTADEVKAVTSGAPLDYSDIGASESDLVTNGDDWTGATGSTPPNSWSDSGGASVTYIIRDNTGVANMDDKVLEIDVSGSGSKTLSQGVFQIGKRYRVTFAYRNLDGSGGATKVTFGSSANSATLQNTTISGDGIIFTQDVLADGADLAFEVTTAGALQIDAVQVVQIGCTLAFRPAGIGQSQWQDTSGNQLHGTVTGAQPCHLPANHVERYVRKGITADTTLTGIVPAGYRVRSIIVEETAGNAITGGLKIGASAGGTEVVNAQAVGANSLVDCALGTRLFSLTAAQTLHVEDVTAWNSASIDLYLEMERIK